MTDLRQAAQQALEKVADALPAYIDGVAAREYLAVIHKALDSYVAPPQHQWQGLTDDAIWQIATDCTIGGDLHADKFARAIEAKLKEKNSD